MRVYFKHVLNLNQIVMKYIIFTMLLLSIIACKKDNVNPTSKYYLEADINGKHIKYSSPTANTGNGTHINSGNTSDTTIAIVLQETTVGTYPLTTSSLHEGVCMIPGFNFFGSASGSITISNVSSSVIEGTFYFTQYNPSNGNRVDVKNGLFKIKLK